MIDMHVHFFPERVFQAIWSFFETQGNHLWPIQYKLYGPELVDELERLGVRRFTTLVYAHKPEMAASLNTFVYKSSKQFPAMIPFGTVFAGDSDCFQEAKNIFENYGFYGIKLHPFVSQEAINDKRLFPVYEMMESMGKVLVCHPGSGPNFSKKDGAKDLLSVLNQFPKLKVIVAHCGACEYGDYQALADRFESVYFDTAMNCTHTQGFTNNSPGKEFFTRYVDRILFGSDFPNIPYAYQHQVDCIKEMGLGGFVEKKIFSENAKRLLCL
jgi:predicted TIM-barrel fold metal-dependent hydrolase